MGPKLTDLSTRPATAAGDLAEAPTSLEEACGQNGHVDFGDATEEDFKQRGEAKHRRGMQKMMQALGFACLLWMSLVAWALFRYSAEPFLKGLQELDMGVDAALQGSGPTTVEVLSMVSPGTLYRPQLLTCGGGRIFTSDRFRVFELFPGGRPPVEVDCAAVPGQIHDLLASCDGSGCELRALVHGSHGPSAASSIVLCGRNGTAALAKYPLPADHIAVAPQGLASGTGGLRKLLAAHANDLVQYSWSSQVAEWVPEWNIGSDGQDGQTSGLRAVSAGDKSVFFFYRSQSAGASVVARSAADLRLGGRWLLPAKFGPLLDGCMLNDTEALLLEGGGAAEDPVAAARIVRARLG